LQFRVVTWRTIRGVVRDATGGPLVGVHVQANHQARSDRGSTRFAFRTFGPTDVAGRFEGRVPAYVGDVDLIAHAPGGSARLKVGPHVGDEVVLQIERENWIRGQVVDSAGNAPRDGWLQALPPTGQTNSGATFDGSKPDFQLLVPSPGRYLLVFTDSVGPLASPDPLPVEAPTEGVRLVCPAGYRLAGRLQGDDVGRFHVEWIQRRGEDRRLAARKTGMTDAEGKFRLDGVRPGESMLHAYRPGDSRYALVRNPQTPDETMVVAMKDGAAVRGRVAGYTGHQGFELWIHVVWDGPARGVPIGDDGTFSIPGLPAGAYGLQWQEGERRGTFDLSAEAGGASVELPRP
jgi:hypothetical protein